MNIIKFKDVLLNSSYGLSVEKIDLFNKHLKGKYSYIINWTYITPFNLISQEEYVKISAGGVPKEGTYLNLNEIPSDFIDLNETNYINNIDKYKNLNKYTTDSDITIDEIKKFRPWLAYSLLNEKVITDSDICHMLEYYNFDDPVNRIGSGMYNDVIKHLNTFGDTYVMINNINSQKTQKSSCSCNTPIKYDVLEERACGIYGVEKVYRMNLYVKMVNTFRDFTFWQQFADTVLIDMKNYIDNIIKVNLPLYSITRASNYCDCGDLSIKDLQQQSNLKILENLSKSLQYIMDDEISGHKNFINDSLFNWASILYERMYWLPIENVNRPINNNNTFMYVNEDGDVLIKGIDSNNNRMDYKLLSGQSTLEPIDDNDIVTGDYLENYLQDHSENIHMFEDLNSLLTNKH
jgi:hypothetical protein